VREGRPRRRGFLRLALAAIIITAVGGVLVWGFVAGRSEAQRVAERERPVKEPLRVSIENGMPVITLDAATQRRNGIATARPAPASYVEEVRAYATVLDLARLTDLANGYANAQAQLETARAKLDASKTAFERAQKLYADQHLSQAQLQAAKAMFRTDQAALSAAESQVRTLAATAQQEWGLVLGRSLVEGSPVVARLIDRRDFLLQVTLPSGVALPTPPPTAAIETGKGARAEIAFVSPATRTDPKIQGLSFFYLAPAASGVLPGMNLLALLPSGPRVEGVAVPAAAIVWWQDRAWVYRRTGPETFTRVMIPTELPAPGGGLVVKNLPAKAELVTSGAQSLLSEEFRAQIEVGED
jgi:hypothetical protein